MHKLLFLVLFVTLALVGCGGSGDGGNTTSSPFAGRWVGTWNSAALCQNGTGDITVATNGTADVTIATNGSVTGTKCDKRTLDTRIRLRSPISVA
jgi:hypothetical protein